MEIIQAETRHLEDAAFLFDQYRQFYKQTEDIEAAFKFLEERTSNNESVIFIAYIENRPVGFMQLYPVFSSISIQRAWLLNDLFVDKNHRQRGVGSALLDAASDFGRERGVKYLMLQTGCENLTAQRLYESKGWLKDNDLFYRYDFADLKNLKAPKLTPSIRK